MGEDVVQNIEIGADASGATATFAQMAATLNSQSDTLTALAGRMGMVTTASGDMADAADAVDQRFSTSVSRGGIFLFSRQMLGMVGLSDVARHAMGAISIGFEELAGTIGVSTAALAPWLFAAGGAILIFEKWHKSHSQATQSLQDLIDKQQKDLTATQELGQAFDDYENAVGPLSGGLKQLAVDTETLTGKEKSLLALYLEHQALDLSKEIEKTAKDYEANINATAGAAAALDHFASGSKEASAQTKEVSTAVKEQDVATSGLRLQLSQVNDELDRYYKTGELVSTKKFLKDQVDSAKEAQAWLDSITASEQKELVEFKKVIDDYAAGRQKMDQASLRFSESEIKRQDEQLAHQQKFFGVSDTLLDDFESASESAYKKSANAFGAAAAQMIVQHKTWHDATISLTKDVETQFIQDVVAMMVKWAAFEAMTGFLGGGSPSIGDMGAQGYAPGVGFGGGPSANFAVGTDFLTNGPQQIGVGESGVERVQVTPVSGGSGGGGAPQNVQVSVSVTAAGVVTDLNSFANTIGQKVIQQIRGQGQLVFTRSS